MMITISLHYPIDDETCEILDIWNLEAPSEAAVEHLVYEYLAPALWRHGRRCALKHGIKESEYCHQALRIDIDETPLHSVRDLCEALADDHPSPVLTDQHLASFRKSPTWIRRIPKTMDDLLSKHGFLEANGGKRRHRPKVEKPPVPPHAESSGDPPPF